jgi:hypothetical protein
MTIHPPGGRRRRRWRTAEWWELIPGMDWDGRSKWPIPSVANALIAMECTRQLHDKSGGSDRPRPDTYADQARALRDWLDEGADGTDDEAYLRRVALCYATEVAPASTSLQDVKKWAHAFGVLARKR